MSSLSLRAPRVKLPIMEDKTGARNKMNFLGAGAFGHVFADSSTVAVKGFQDNDVDVYWWEVRILGLLQDTKYMVHTTQEISFATRRSMIQQFACFYGMKRAHFDLTQYVRTTPRPTRAVIWTVLQDMFRALMELKKHRIVHMDIKPGNILYFEEEELWKLCDFGCARETTKDSHYVRPGRGGYDGQPLLGTYEFQSPESLYAGIRMLNDQVPPAYDAHLSDVYSVGVTCIWTITHGKYWNGKLNSQDARDKPLASMKAMLQNAKAPMMGAQLSLDTLAGPELSSILQTMVMFLPRHRSSAWIQISK